jgi:uncharacterized protein (DUF1501 family)
MNHSSFITSITSFTSAVSSFSSFKQRRDFLKTAAGAAVAGALPTLDALNNVAHAAGSIDTSEVAADYKAIVCVFFYGGQDHSNTLIPYLDGNAAGDGAATTTTEFDRYAQARSNFSTSRPAGDLPNMAPGTGNLAYTRAALAATALTPTTTNSVSKPGGWTTNTHGRQFALHPNYAELKAIYDTGKLAVIANVGPLAAPVTRAQWYGPSATKPALPLSLYSHDDQQKAWMSGTPRTANPSVGTAGRIANHPAIVALNVNAQISTQISISGSNTFMLTDVNPSPSAIAYQMGTGSVGRLQAGTTPPTCNTNSSFITANPTLPYCISGGPIGISSGYSYNATLKGAFAARMTNISEGVSIYSDQWRQTMRQSIDTQAVVATAFSNSPPTEDIVGPFASIIGGGTSGIPYNNLAAQLRMVAATIRASSQLGAAGGAIKRQIFFVSVGGFDTHGGEFWTNNPNNNSQNSKAINAFWTALGNVKVTGVGAETARDHVTLFTMSEFGRTLDSNGLGSDHGWGTHQIVLGGAVKGGFIYGQNHNVTSAAAGTTAAPSYMEVDTTAGAVPRIGLPPSPYSGSVRIANKLNHALSRGELLPTTSSDAVIGTIAKWFGIPATDINTLLPALATAHPTGSDMGFMG